MEIVFCDLDGTLINSEEERINTYFSALEECNIHNYQSPPNYELLGNSEKKNLSIICPNLTESKFNEVIKIRKKYLDLIDVKKIKININVFELVKQYKQLIIVTNSSIDYAKKMRDFILKIPCKIVALSENMPAKPDPYLYKKAFDLYAQDNKKIVFEDSKAGINSAKSAGADIIYRVVNNEKIELYK